MNKKAQKPIIASILISFLLIFSIASYFVMAEELPPGTIITRTAFTTKTCYPGGYCTMYESKGQINYFNGSEYLPINKTIVTSSDPLFDYEVTNGIYQTYFKSNPTQGQVVKFIKNNTEITFQPMALNYRNDLDMIQQVNMIQNVIGVPNGSEFLYENAYGSGIDLQYKYTNRYLKEELILDNFSVLISPEQYIIDGGNPTLDLDFVLITDSNHIVIEGADWDKSTTKETSDEVYIEDDEGNVLYYLSKPYAYDSNHNLQLLKYQFKKSGAKLYVILKTPYSWLNSPERVYPVYIDPTTTSYQEDANATACAGDWLPYGQCSAVYDGDWDTYGGGYDVGYFYANYSKPQNASSSASKWRFKAYTSCYSPYTTVFNLSLDSNCWNQEPLQFQVISDINHFSSGSCWNGTGWFLLKNNTELPVCDASVAEEAMVWEIYQPLVTIDYPQNNSWLNNNVSINLNFTYLNSSTMDTCLFTTDNYATNTTIANCLNTTFNRTEGNYLLGIWVNETGGDTGTDLVNFTIDLTYPQISYEPETEADYANKSQSSIYVNVTWTETNFDNITFSLYNATATVNSTTFTTATYDINWTGLNDDNNYTYEVNITDMANNKNYTTLRHITLDNIEPYVSIDYPKAQSYSTNESLSLNYTVSDAVSGIDSCWFKVINSTSDLIISNTTIASCLNTTFNVSQGEGTYNLTLYSNDTANNLNSSEVKFGISLTGPAVVLDAPINYQNLSNGTNVSFNFTTTDVDGLDTCQVWHNNTGIWHKNYTWIGPTSGTQNYTILNLSEVTSIWNIWCNDTADNKNWALSNFTLTIDETNPNVTFNTTNDTSVTSLAFTFEYNISDTHLKECYFTLRTIGGLLHNYPENTSLTCSSTSRSISTTYYGTFVLQIWGEDYAGNLGDANLTFTTLTSGDPGGGGDGEEPIVYVYENKSFCGDLICQSEGNDYGIKENYWNCPQDCPGAVGENLDILIASLTSYCWDGDNSTICFWTQMLFATVPGMGPPEELENITFYKDGQICIGEICERISMKTLFSNCISGEGPCFFSSNFGVLSLFGFGSLLLGISFLRVPVQGMRQKVSPYTYIGLKIKKKGKRRKWQR